MKFLILLVLTALMIPFKKDSIFVIKRERFSKEVKKKYLNPMIVMLPIVFWIIIAFVEYFILLDNNVNSLLTGYAIISSAFILISVYLQKGKQNWENNLKITVAAILAFSFIYVELLNPMLSAGTQYKAVNKVNNNISEEFNEDDTPFIVPPETAKNKMKKVFGEIKGVSYYELGELTPQKVNGQLVYVAPIEISDFWKANKAGYSPGYITMSGTNPDAEAELHDNFKMKYIPSNYFNKNLERHVRSAEPDAIFKGKPTLEVDDSGKPYYIITYGNFVSGRSGFNAQGVIVTDPQTGEVKKYAADQAPKFIDGVINYETAGYLNDVFGNYVHGFFNFSKTDVKQPTDWGTEEGVTPIFGKDGKMYFFTDFTSPKSGVDSALGYSLVDARTGKLTYYAGRKEMAGVMDGSGAQEVVNNTFKKDKWTGTMPVLYNVYGKASWVVPVIDSGGLVRSYAVVEGSNAKVFATDPIEKEAFKKYKNALTRGDGMVNVSSSSAKAAKIEGTVVRTYKEVNNSTTTIYIMLSGHKEIFMVSSTDFPYSLFTEVGDKIKLTYSNTGDQMVSVSDYTNFNINQ